MLSKEEVKKVWDWGKIFIVYTAVMVTLIFVAVIVK